MKWKKKKRASGQKAQKKNSEPEYSVDEIISQFWDEYEEPEYTDGEFAAEADDSKPTETAEAVSGAGSGFAEETVTEEPPQWLEDDGADEESSWSIRDILDEYREDALVDEISAEEIQPNKGNAEEPARKPASDQQTPSEASEEEPASVWESFPEESLVSGIGDIAEAVPQKPAEQEPEEIGDLSFDLPYSLRDIMQEFWDAGETGVPADDTAPAPEEAADDVESDWRKYEIGPESSLEESLPAEEVKDEALDFSWGALLWGKEELAAEPETVVEEQEASAEQAAEENAESKPAAVSAVQDTEIQTPVPEEDATGGISSWRKPGRKVTEEFPDTPNTSDEPFVDTLDYAALFKMFAEEPSAEEEPAAEEELSESETDTDASDARTDAEEFEDWLASSGMSPEEVLAAIDAPSAGESGKKPAAPEEKEPLLAERSDEMDFRNILREFMMGDQHPIYGDIPGIGSKPQSSVPAEDGESLTGSEEESADARDTDDEAESYRPRREYEVEEDFPLDLDSLMVPGSWGQAGAAKDKAETDSTSDDEEDLSVQPADGDAASGSAAEGYDLYNEAGEPETEAAEGGFKSRLRDILAGRGRLTGSRADRKKAINEPKAYLGYEDYLPDEKAAEAEAEEAVPEEKPERAGGAHAAPDGGELDEGIGEAAAVPGMFDGDNLSDDDLLDYEADFPTFGQWILNELMNLWIRINGVGDRQSTATMEDEREDPGPEVNVASASRYYGSQVTMLRMRFQLGLALLAVLAYITLGFPVSGMLKTAKVASAVCLGLQLTIMLLCLDVVTNAVMNVMRGRFGADGLALLACIISCFDALVVAVGGFGSPHIPLCLFSSLALMGILLSSLLSARALRKSTRVPAIGKRSYCVTAEEGVRGGKDITLLKSIRPVTGFVHRSEEAPPDETLFNRFAFPALLVVLVLSLLTGLVKHSMRDFLYILSAMLTCTVPVTALASFAMPFFVGSQRIFSSGAAVAGWSGIHDIGCSRNLIVTDRDLFPEETISIETVRVFADESAERVIAYAGTMIAASGSGLGPCFSELMERNGCRMRQVEDFKWLAGGGLQGLIEGHLVLCGSSDLMQLMNVKIPYRLVDRTTVLLSIDGVLYGIFKVVYNGQPEIRSALQELIASNRHPIFAIRDFNITPDMLHEVFDVATDGYDFPPYGDRFRISEAQPSETSKISAVICREGLGPLTHLADTGRSMYVAVRLNLLVTALTAILGTLLVFFRLIGPGLLNAWLPFVLMIVDMILVTLITVFMRF